MKSQNVLMALTIIAQGTLYERRIMSRTGTHAAGKAGGVCHFDTATGNAATMNIRGICNVISGAAVSIGDLITADAAGKAIAYVPNSNIDGEKIEILGVALTAASGADEIISVDVNPFVITGSGNETMTVTAAEAITANRIVDIAGTHTVNKGIGVAIASAYSAATATLQISGTIAVTTGGAFAIGDYITADADGKAVKFDPTAINLGTPVGVVGVAVQQSTGADQSKTIRLFPCVGVGTKAIG